MSYYECEDCSNCPVRSLCTKAQKDSTRRIQKNWTWNPIKQWSKNYCKKNPKDLWS
ncbi:transposase [Enterococcus lactis]|nr:transposase [Enterococcus lactis]